MWVDVNTAAYMLHIGIESLYSQISKDKAKGLSFRFKKENGKTLVNVDTYYRNKVSYETQKAFEDLYFELIELLPTKQHLYKKVAQIIGKNENAVTQYFFQMFATGSEPMKQKYVNAMQQIKVMWDLPA